MVFSCTNSSMQLGRTTPSNRNEDTKSHITGTELSTCDQIKIQQDFRQRINAQGEATRDSLSFNEDLHSAHDSNTRTKLEPTNNIGINRERQLRNQQRWILLLCHAKRCKAPQGKCHEIHCLPVQQLLKHMDSCVDNMLPCKYPRCDGTKLLVRHYKQCSDTYCLVCVPVKNFMKEQKARLHSVASSHPNKSRESLEDVQPSFKRIKVEKPLQPLVVTVKSESFPMSISPSMDQSRMSLSVPSYEYRDNETLCTSTKPELSEVKIEVTCDTNKDNIVGILNEQSHACRNNDPSCVRTKTELPEVKGEFTCDMNKGNVDGIHNQVAVNESSSTSDGFDDNAKKGNAKSEIRVDENKPECSIVNALGTKIGRQKIKGVSLTELFTPDEVREHIKGLRQWVGQSRAKTINIAMEQPVSVNSCQLCAVEQLFFDPPPIYCTSCAGRIKRNAMYYMIRTGDTQHCFCMPCYNGSRGESMVVDGTAIPKRTLMKKKNNEETEEGWVQCDKCESWQHQVCALFNGRRNDVGQAEYTCSKCYISEVERGERTPLPQNAVLGANDLPKTMVSDHIEQRLFKRLKKEREERARVQGKSYDEVPGAEDLVIRVVSSVEKKVEVRERFLEFFQGSKYPTEFPYKSKVVLLFQRIEGVEVCLFAMYVYEFGSECEEPNNRRVYLSYLDSVKYFRPDIKTVTGEALRTLVYHEILIGYLEYIKKRGFTSCYIWACPPLKGEDYILYCHPEIQKTPKSDKLRDWYLYMLKKALKENIVVELTNLYDHFFTSTGECKAKVTATRLPYFDGDYWPDAAEDMINQLSQEDGGGKQPQKGTNKNIITKRALKACGQSPDLSGNPSKDWLLMHKLGETLYPMKEDFIMVHLQHMCSHCSLMMVCGSRWVCFQCKRFELCDKCYESEQKLEEMEKHPPIQKDKHAFYQVVINDVPEDTKDKDDILESEFFDTRQTFLSLCQGNHYQFDTLRRAKHSSMMVLYHLHNPTAPAFVTTCNVCHIDNEGGQSWRCEVCPDFDVCNSCYEKNGGINHPHKLTNHLSMGDHNAQDKETRKQRFVQLRQLLDSLVHTTACHVKNCQYPKCNQLKGLFWHGGNCKTRAANGCIRCQQMWYFLLFHARTCKDSKCHVPRCSDLKQVIRVQQLQSDSRRRAAVREMMRQRAAEVSTLNDK